MGAVLHLSGLQRPRRLDAHVERRRRDRRIPRDGREKGRASYFYKYGNEERPVDREQITVPYKTAAGMAKKEFTVYRTHHGPIVREPNGKWVALRLMQEPVKALTQSYSRTKAKNYKTYSKTMELHTNSSNNTIFADADGNIAYFHGNFIPKRDPKFDWTQAGRRQRSGDRMEGPAVASTRRRNLLNPASGWLYNSNNWPWSAAGPSSPKKADFPAYVENGQRESARGLHAIRVLENKKDFTLDSLIAAAYDSYLPCVREAAAGAGQGVGRAAGGDPLKAKTRRADRAAARVGLALGASTPFRRRSPSSGARSCGATAADARR